MIKTSKESKGLTLPLSNCGNCTLYKEASYNPHNYWGTLKNPDVLFIGEAPGKTEKATGKAFQGRAGRLLQDSLRKIGIKSFAIANVVACRPETIDPKYGRLRDRKPTPTEIKNCAENLDSIIAQVKPKYIAALGATAMNRMKIKGGITVNRGVMAETEYGPVIPIYHPAYILRAPNFITEFRQDLKTLKSFIGGNKDIAEPQGDYIVIEDPTEVEELETILAKRKAFAFDIETDGLLDTVTKVNNVIRIEEILA